MITRSASLLVALVSVLLFAGCYSPARRLDVSAVKRIRVGMSKAEVQALMGDPREAFTSSDGRVVTRYYFQEYQRSVEASPVARSRSPGGVLFRTLTLMYGSDNRITRKLHDESINPIRQDELHWLAIGPRLDPESLHIRKGVGRAPALITRFGEPISRTLDASGNSLLVWLYFRERSNQLGKPTVRTLRVLLGPDDVIADYMLVDTAPEFWLFR